MPNVFQNIVTRHPLTKDGVYEWDFAVSGYFFFKFTKAPKAVSLDDLSQLQALCTGITLPDINITVNDRQGLGGLRTGVVTSLDMGTTFEIRFVEIVHPDGSYPLLYYIAKWANAVRNFMTGVANKDTAFSMNDYKAHGVFLATDPTVTKVVVAARVWGFVPTTVPMSNYHGDIATNDFIEYTVPGHIDRIWPILEDHSEVSNFLSELRNYLETAGIDIPATT